MHIARALATQVADFHHKHKNAISKPPRANPSQTSKIDFYKLDACTDFRHKMGNLVADGLSIVRNLQRKKQKYEAAHPDLVLDSVAKKLKWFNTQIEQKATLALTNILQLVNTTALQCSIGKVHVFLSGMSSRAQPCIAYAACCAHVLMHMCMGVRRYNCSIAPECAPVQGEADLQGG